MAYNPPPGLIRDDRGVPLLPVAFPEWLTWGVRSGGTLLIRRGDDDRRLKGENGKPHCLWCRAECTGRRTSYCSNLCLTYAHWTWGWAGVREYVMARDVNCRLCGAGFAGWAQSRNRFTPGDFFVEKKWGPTPSGPASRLIELAWEVDHIMPVSLGGTDDPANLRLACHGCHAGETAKLARFLAKSKRVQRRSIPVLEFDLLTTRG